MPFNVFALPALAALIVQVIVLFLVVYGYWLKRRLEFPRHGKVMSWAVFLHLVTIVLVMVPSFVFAIISEYIVPNSKGLVSILALIHVPLGLTAVSFGVWFALSWRYKGLQGCFRKKRLMLFTIIVWLVTLSLGFILFAILNLPLLFS